MKNVVYFELSFPFLKRVMILLGVTSFDGWCRYGSDAREFIGSVTSNEVSKCKEQCSSTNGCTAFAYTIEASNNCNLYRNGPYTYGNGKEKTTCYIMHSGTWILIYFRIITRSDIYFLDV